MLAMGSIANPVRLDPWQRIISVHWGGSLGICTVECLGGFDLLYTVRSKNPDREFTSTISYSESHPPDPGPDEFIQVNFPAEDDTTVPSNAYNKVPVVVFRNLRTNDLPGIETDPGGEEQWNDLANVFRQYEPESEKTGTPTHADDDRYIIGGTQTVTDTVFGEPGTPGTYIGGDAMVALGFPPYGVPQIPENYAHDEAERLAEDHPGETYRLAVRNPHGTVLQLVFQQLSITEPHFADYRRDVFLINFSKVTEIEVRMDESVSPPGFAPDTKIKVEVFGKGTVQIHSDALGPPPPPLPEEPTNAQFAQHLRVSSTLKRSFERLVAPSSHGSVVRFNSAGFL